MTEKLLTIVEVARFLCVRTNTVRNWTDKGLLRVYRIGARGDRRFRQKDIDEFLKRE